MSTISLKLTRPSIGFGNSPYGPSGWTISFSSEQANASDEIILTTGGKLSDIDGMVGFQNSETTETYNGHERGTISYWKGSNDVISPRGETYLVSIRLNQSDLERLTGLVTQGFLLRGISIEVPFELGWQPDGSGMEWDNKKNPKAEIEGFRLYFGEAEPDTDDDKNSWIEPVEMESVQSPEVQILSKISRRVGIIVAMAIFAFIALAFVR